MILKEIRPPVEESSTPRVGGNRKMRSFKICQMCLGVFGPLDRYARKYCSQGCKVKAQTTGRRRHHIGTRKARSAQSLVAYHVRVGNLNRPVVCEQCGQPNFHIEAAHYDYDVPLAVRWLCVSCHRRWDKECPKHGTVIVAVNADAEEKAPTVVEAKGTKS